jgi:Cu/Ag efflux protein CusF
MHCLWRYIQSLFLEVPVLKMNTGTGFIYALLASVLMGNAASAAEDMPSPLDVDQHPTSPPYESLFPDEVVPLDTELSWKRRFRGDETFNSDETLPPTSSVLERLSNHSGSSASGESMPGGFDASGVVRQVRLSEGKIKVEHGPIDRLGMPGMTMMFRVEDPAQLAGLGKGSEIDFDVDNTAAGFSITRLAMKSSRFDATGVVKQVRMSEGKLKIEHGPIDRLGMPGMTMMFKVRDAQFLVGLQREMPVDFDVINGPGGFEITRIRPANGSQMAAAVARLCYRVGPFAKQDQARAVDQRYRDRGAATRLKSASEKQYVGTMVYIDGHTTREAALATARDLQAKGIEDYRLFNEPGKQHAISLGVFGQQQNAARLKDRATAMNYPAKTEPRYRQRTALWLHVEQTSTMQTPQLLTAAELESGIRQVPGDCLAQEKL